MATRHLVAMACAAGALGLALPRSIAETLGPGAERDSDEMPESPGSSSSLLDRAVEEGQFLPFTLTPRTGSNGGLAAAHAGYDGARGAVMDSYAEVTLWGPLALRGGAAFGDSSGRARPSVGGRLQLLSERRHGLDGAMSVSYRAEGFTEPEGEIETVLALGRQVRGVLLVVNLAYGQDPEGRERDGEGRVAALGRISRRVRVGVDGRWRFDLGSDAGKLRASHEPTTDLDAGPVVAIALGPVALTGHAGASVVRRIDAGTRVGMVALAGMGTAF